MSAGRSRRNNTRGADTHMTTPTGAFRFLCRGLAAFALIALIPLSASAQSGSQHSLERVTGTVIGGGPLTDREETVVLKMGGDAVAVVRSRMPANDLA